MHYTCRYLPGANTNSLFSKYWENEPDDPLTFSQFGHLFGYLSLQSTNPAHDLANLSSQLITTINQSYFRSGQLPYPTHLKIVLEQSVAILPPDCQLSIAIFAQKDLNLAIASFGQVDFYLRRQHQLSQLITPDSTQISFISGPVQDQDLLFIANSSLITNALDINQFLSLVNLDQQEDYLTQKLANQPSFASVLVQIHQDQSVDTSPVPEASSQSLSPQKSTIKSVFSLFRRLPSIFPTKSITVSTPPSPNLTNRKKRHQILAILALVGLITSLLYSNYKKTQTQNQDTFFRLEAEVQQHLKNIESTRKLSLEDAQALAQQASSAIDQMAQIYPDRVESYRSQIDQILAQTGLAQYTQLTPYYNTALITDNPSYSSLVFANQKLYLLDSQKGRLDSLTGQSSQSVSLDPLVKQTINLISLKSDLYALTSDGLYQITKKDWPKTVSLSPPPLSAFSWGSAIYYLSSSTITRSSLVNNVLADPVAWLTSNQSLPDSLVSMAIDGKVWLLSQNGVISVYLRGQKDNFSLSQPPQTSSASHLLVAQDKDILIFLADPKTVVVYTKAGQLLSKYNLGDYDIKSIALDESTSTLYLLASDQKIYTLTL